MLFRSTKGSGAEGQVSTAARAWKRFRRHRRGWISLWVFLTLFVLSLGAELIANDRPLLVQYQGEMLFPLWNDYPRPVSVATSPPRRTTPTRT